MFAQQQTQQLVGSARTARVVSSRYVFHIDERKDEERERSHSFFEFFLFPILNARRGRRRRLWISFLARFWVNEMISKRKTKRENENASPLSSRSKERERERERDVYSSFNAFQFLLEETNLFSFFLPNCLSLDGQIFVSFAQNTHKISLSLLNATM